MTGLIVLGLIAAYVATFVLVIRYARNRGEKFAAILIAVLFPAWDIPVGYFSFSRSCDTDGGARQIADIAPQNSLYFTSYPGEPEHFLNAGLKAVEYGNTSGGIQRFERAGKEKVDRHVREVAESPLQLRLRVGEKLSWGVLKQEYVLEERGSGRPIARATTYSWLGGWLSTSFEHGGPWAVCHPLAVREIVDWAVKGRRV